LDKLLKGSLFVGAVLIGYNLFAKKTAAGTLNFLPGQFHGIGTDGGTPVLSVGVLIQNTSNQSYQLNSLAGNVYANNSGNVYTVGNVSTFTRQTIYPNNQEEIIVDMRLSLTGIVSDLINSISSGFGQDISFKGYANVDGLQIPILINYKL
jgi:hypothetical protein